MPALSYTASDFPFTPFTKILSASVNTCFNDVKTLLNTTKLDDTNLQTNGITRIGSTSKLKTGTAYAIMANATDGNMAEISAGTSAQFLGGNTGGAATFRALTTADFPAIAVNTYSSDHSLSTSNDLVLATGTTNLTLPAASVLTGKVLRIKKTDAIGTVITITRAGSDTIDGATTTTLNTQYEQLELMSDGSASWTVIARNYPQTYTSYTPSTTGCGTVTSKSCFWKRVGGAVELQIGFLTGTVTGTTITIDMPTGMTTSTAVLALGAGRCIVGFGSCENNQINNTFVTAEPNVSVVKIGIETTTDIWTSLQVGNHAFGSSSWVSFKALVPIQGWN